MLQAPALVLCSLVCVFAHKLNTHHLELLNSDITIPEFIVGLLQVVVSTVTEILKYILLFVFVQFFVYTIVDIQLGAAAHNGVHFSQ